jgi:hypothetical protein
MALDVDAVRAAPLGMDAAGDHQAADLTVELDGGQAVADGGDPALTAATNSTG